MNNSKVHFDNGSNYEKLMGTWSELIGSLFLDWLALPQKIQWLDDGCGNGDLTEMIIKHFSPERISGIDLSSELLNYARTRLNCQLASFELGNAMNLPYVDNNFDVSVMALVIFFLSEPAKGLSEMIRVVRSGGCVATYAWDMQDDLYPLAPINKQLFAMGREQILPPNVNASKMSYLHDLWVGANLQDVQTKELTVSKTFNTFEDYWSTALLATDIKTVFNAMNASDQRLMKEGVRKNIKVTGNNQVIVLAKANAVRGQVA